MARKQTTKAKSTHQASRNKGTSHSQLGMPAQDLARSPVANMPANALIENVAQAAQSESAPFSATMQPKLTVGAVGDPYEQEADRVARQVVSQLQSPQAEPKREPDDAIVQRQVEIDHHTTSTVQADMGLEGGAVGGEVESKINSAKGGGRSLSAKTQTEMGNAMGADFSSVKVHSDRTADQLNYSLQSRAFTTGPHVFFKKNEYNPSSSSGQELLAHELTHTVQQGASPQVQQQVIPQQQTEPNNTGMPLQLKAGVESLSGMSMGDVKVHYNSPEPVKIGALAYTQGTDIHLAPKQEKHLAHEAWHVVQQKQGRVPVTTQFKKLAGNDSSALEHEADVMGAKAATFTRTQPVGMVQQTSMVQRQVVQARLPVLSEEVFNNEPGVVRELLIHAARNMTQDELDAFSRAMTDFKVDLENEYYITADAMVEHLKTTDNTNLKECYLYIASHLVGDHIYEEDAPDKSFGDLATEHKGELKRELSGIAAYLGNIIGNTDVQQQIFGPEYSAEKVDGVYTAIRTAINKSLSSDLVPIIVSGKKKHMEWVGAGALAGGGSGVTVGDAAFNNIIAGNENGVSTLVHEFSHFAAKTDDVAYSKSGMAKLTTVERMKNAETYAQAFREAAYSSDPSRHYDDERVVDPDVAQPDHVDQAAKNVKGQLKYVYKTVVDLWNLIDNIYNIAVDYKAGDKYTYKQASPYIRDGMTPYNIPISDESLPMILSLFEDRARALRPGNFKTKRVQELLRAKGVQRSQLEAKKPKKKSDDTVMYTAMAIEDALNLSHDDAKSFVKNLIKHQG